MSDDTKATFRKLNEVATRIDAGISKDHKWFRAWRVFEQIGASATWHISASSEGCKISIAGMAVLLTMNEPMHTFLEITGPYDLADCVLEAAAEYERRCGRNKSR